jgi:nicotinate-nucleotide pyrophosphorylase (carboxylating)
MSQPSHDPVGIALAEDIGPGDITSRHFVPAELQGIGRIVAREPAVIAGTGTAVEVFRRVDETLDIEILIEDGSRVENGGTILEIGGSVRSILTAERVALNFLQRLSGIATLTRQFVDAIAGSRAQILDTRKTTPGLRALEKLAVAAGGGKNHRFGLFDMVLVKDNHVSARGDTAAIAAAISEVRTKHAGVRVEVEADTIDQVRAFLAIAGVDVILLDNMTPETMREAVKLRGNLPVQLEASGGISLRNVAEVAATGVDFISVGAVTHSARAIDLSLELSRAADG